ncbi:methyltransferase family protein [Thiomicrorhabdus aquaedulcis]|uniref:methyltransferase family protein n=1 Tax=Thiomicrorhabdus aquaedulcis TaxID=2211106 RepID=UPI000FD84C45|nr:isoprenylcysteine carboxylmethyltransferase family protein [Thiomicrorhabdus aquaedulcis]
MPSNQTLKHPSLSFGLVAAQFTLIALLLLNLPWQFSVIALIAQFSAIVLGLWAIKTMHLGHFNIVPDPMPDIELVTTGPYSKIRHPMYASILLFFSVMVIEHNSLITYAIYATLTLALVIKLSYEERLLKEQLPFYALYQQKTKRLIPGVF